MISHHRFIGRVAVLAAFSLGMLAACGGDGKATVRGKVSDGAGTQQQGLTSGGFGGQGSVAAVTKVRISSIGANGALSTVAEVNVTAGGSYSLDVPSGQKKLVVQSLSASGEVVSSAIVESTGTAGSTVTEPPMDSETSVEASVLIQMVAQGTSLAEANAIDVRARINSNVAVAVTSTATAGGDAQAKIKGLAEAVIAAQRTQLKAFAQSGTQTSQSALFDAQLSAAQALNVALDSGSSANAYADFLASIGTAQAAATGADAQKQAKAESAADASFRATVKVRIGASDPVGDAALRQSAVLEARASAAAVDAILKAGGAATSVQTSASTAQSNLKAQLSAATSASAAASAFASYKGSFTAQGSTGVVGAYVGASGAGDVSLQAALSATAAASTTLDTSLNTAFAASVKATGAVDFDTLANTVVTSYLAFDNLVLAQATALAVFGTKAGPALDLLVVTQGSFKAG